MASERSYRDLVRAWGEPAPGPGGLMLPPEPAALAARAYFEFHPFGVEMRRAFGSGLSKPSPFSTFGPAPEGGSSDSDLFDLGSHNRQRLQEIETKPAPPFKIFKDGEDAYRKMLAEKGLTEDPSDTGYQSRSAPRRFPSTD